MRGFENAPISLSYVVWVLIGSLCLSDLAGRTLRFDVDKVNEGEYARVFFSQFIFGSLPQGVIGIFLIYNFRQFERMMGIRKFAAFVFLMFWISLLIQISIMVAANMSDIHLVSASGPYFFVFSMLPLFYHYIPVTKGGTKLFGGLITYSEKTWIYLMAIQLFFSEGLPTVLASVSGILAGSLYLVDGLALSRIRFPSMIETVVSSSYTRIRSMFPAPAVEQLRPQGAAGRMATGFRRPNGFGGYGTNAFAQTPAVPSREAIEALTNLGFDEEAATNALRQTSNNVDAAANLLLQG
jgi:hypothetical protein